MRHLRVRVWFPFLSSVFRSAMWRVSLSAAIISAGTAGQAADTQTERMIGPGVKCITLTRERGPWLIQVIEADGASGYVRAGATFAAERGLRAAPVSAQASQITTESRYPIAGVNGDFFVKSAGPFEADPIGALVIGGEVISTPYPRSAMVIGADGRYAIQRLRLAAWVERADGQRRELQGVNQPRGTDGIVLYTPRFGLSTTTNAHGTEATLTGVELPLRLGQTYRARVAAVGDRGDSPIPADGVALSAHGAAREFLRGLKADDEVQFRLEFEPAVAPDTDVIGGGPTLLREGRVVVAEDTEGFKPDVVAGRAPRTAVGFNGRRLLLVTVDGRQPGVSAGMTLVELAELMRELGCTDAMNFDGGGSTTAWVRGAVVNRPSDGRERRVANSLFLFSTAPKGPPVRLTVAPEEIAILTGATCPVTVTAAEDEFYNPVPLPAEGVTWRVEPELGMVSPPSPPILGGAGGGGAQVFRRSGVQAFGTEAVGHPLRTVSSDRPAPTGTGQFTAHSQSSPVGGTARVGVLRVEAGKAKGSARVRVYTRAPRVEVTPSPAVVAPGGTQVFAARVVDEQGRPVIADGVPVRWSCPPELGRVDEAGLFQAVEAPGRGELTVEIAGTRVTVPVVVGVETRPLDGFEQVERWIGSVVPAGVKGTVTVTDKAPREGQKALRLEYDFTGERATRAVYATGKLSVGRPVALRVWARGDGGGGWLRARLRDAQGQAHIAEFTRDLGRLDDWRELTASLSSAIEGPLTLEALYLAEPDPLAQTKGAVDLDGLTGDYAPAERGLAQEPLRLGLPKAPR